MRDDDLLLFKPHAPKRRRANGWTPEVQRAFIGSLARCGVVTAAARSVGRTAHSAYGLRDKPGAEGFADAWELAIQIGWDAARGALFSAVLDPERVPVFHRGCIVGWQERPNQRLMIAALRAITAVPPVSKRREPPIRFVRAEPVPPPEPPAEPRIRCL